MSIITVNKKPLKVKCFQCKKSLEVKWVIGKRNYSQKNDWNYWIENKENKDKKICNECLKKVYEENGITYKSFSSKKKNLFRVYLSSGKFN